LTVRRGADQEHPFAPEYGAVEPIHHQRRDLGLTVVQGELHFLRAQLRRAGHRPDQDGDFH
jgi:hypothetical protein